MKPLLPRMLLMAERSRAGPFLFSVCVRARLAPLFRGDEDTHARC
jgi:hypothetical protein